MNSYRPPNKDPTYRNGERATLKDDPRQNPWIVIETRPYGTIVIQREARPANIYTRTYALPTQLKRAGETP